MACTVAAHSSLWPVTAILTVFRLCNKQSTALCAGGRFRSYSCHSRPCKFLLQVNVRQPAVNAFGIRLNAELAAVPQRISSSPAGQIIPPEIGGPAWLWNITFMGARVFTFTVDTSGLVEANGAMSPRMSALRLSDICAQGIVVADDQGNPFWEQPTTTSTCV